MWIKEFICAWVRAWLGGFDSKAFVVLWLQLWLQNPMDVFYKNCNHIRNALTSHQMNSKKYPSTSSSTSLRRILSLSFKARIDHWKTSNSSSTMPKPQLGTAICFMGSAQSMHFSQNLMTATLRECRPSLDHVIADVLWTHVGLDCLQTFGFILMEMSIVVTGVIKSGWWFRELMAEHNEPIKWFSEPQYEGRYGQGATGMQLESWAWLYTTEPEKVYLIPSG